MTNRIRPASLADVHYLAPRLRAADVQEIKASHGLDPLSALLASCEVSDQCSVFVDVFGNPCALFGTAPTPDLRSASVWLLGTDEISGPTTARDFLRLTRGELDRLHAGGRYRVLYNYVDERNEASIRWLKWAGCVFIARHPEFGVERRPFLEFVHIERP